MMLTQDSATQFRLVEISSTGTVYYVLPANGLTTEINLRSERMLTGVERFSADSVLCHQYPSHYWQYRVRYYLYLYPVLPGTNDSEVCVNNYAGIIRA